MSSSFKNVTNKGQFRRKQKQQSSSEESDDQISVRIDQLKSKKPGRGIQHSTSKKPRKDESNVSSSSDDDNLPTSSIIGHSYQSSRSGKREGPGDMGATAEIELDTQQDRDALAIIDKVKKAKEAKEGDTEVKTNVPFYQGNVTQQDALKKNQRYGPQRAPLNIRSTTRWDYAPDICKDYKETGSCGFGDSCKFLHDRSDFKFGWQIDADYESGRDNEESKNYEIHDESRGEARDDDDIPDECWVCRENYKDPVVTLCNHYFCEKCFVSSVANNLCPVCSTMNQGYAKTATKLIQKLKGKSAK